MTDLIMLANFKDRFSQHFGDTLSVTWFTTEPTEPHPVIGELTYNNHTFQIIGCWKDQVDIQLVPPQGKYISAYSASDGFTTFRVTSHQQFNLEQLYWNFNDLIDDVSLISSERNEAQTKGFIQTYSSQSAQ